MFRLQVVSDNSDINILQIKKAAGENYSIANESQTSHQIYQMEFRFTDALYQSD